MFESYEISYSNITNPDLTVSVEDIESSGGYIYYEGDRSTGYNEY